MELEYNPQQMAEINRTSGSPYTPPEKLSNFTKTLRAVGAFTDLAGLGLSAYGQYQANETAKDNYKLALMQYNDWKKQQRLIQEYNKRQNALANTMQYGQYAQGIKKDDEAAYGRYNESIGR